jgi:hypothetical protein
VSGATPLTEEEDAFGRYLLDWLDGHAGELLLERDDGEGGPALGGEWFFAEPEVWAETERAVLRLVQGRVLDVGAGAGRHSLEAQARGSRSSPSTSHPGPSRPAAAAGCATRACSRWRPSTSASGVSTQC